MVWGLGSTWLMWTRCDGLAGGGGGAHQGSGSVRSPRMRWETLTDLHYWEALGPRLMGLACMVSTGMRWETLSDLHWGSDWYRGRRLRVRWETLGSTGMRWEMIYFRLQSPDDKVNK